MGEVRAVGLALVNWRRGKLAMMPGSSERFLRCLPSWVIILFFLLLVAFSTSLLPTPGPQSTREGAQLASETFSVLFGVKGLGKLIWQRAGFF